MLHAVHYNKSNNLCSLEDCVNLPIIFSVSNSSKNVFAMDSDVDDSKFISNGKFNDLVGSNGVSMS